MKVLLINGSPKEKGCTAVALSEFATELKAQGITTENYWIGTKPISGCVSCGFCAKTKSGKCAIDDQVNVFLKKSEEFDGFVFGSPVYFAGPNSSLTAFMDRVFYVGRNTIFPHKPACAVVSNRRAGSSASLDRLNKYFTISQMPVVSSRYWNGIHGNTPDEARQDLEGLQIMRYLAKNMAWLLKCISAGKEKGILPPVLDKQIKTNYIR